MVLLSYTCFPSPQRDDHYCCGCHSSCINSMKKTCTCILYSLLHGPTYSRTNWYSKMLNKKLLSVCTHTCSCHVTYSIQVLDCRRSTPRRIQIRTRSGQTFAPKANPPFETQEEEKRRAKTNITKHAGAARREQKKKTESNTEAM